MDKGHRYTDKQLEKLEEYLKKHYKGVSDELINELMQSLEANEEDIQALWDKLDNGETANIDEFVYKKLDKEIDELAQKCVEADVKAMGRVWAVMQVIYVYNHNSTAKSMNKKTGKLIPLIKRISRKKRLLKPPNPKKMKDRLWHRVKIRAVISEGLRRGRDIPDISRRMSIIMRMDTNAAIRAARTAITNAENQGKLEAMYTMRDEFGVDVKKMWYATLDNRTRTAHRMIHGEIRELEETFSNGLQFPADPDGDASEVWNCRCTLLEVIGDIDIPESPRSMNREQWEQKTPKYKHYPDIWQ